MLIKRLTFFASSVTITEGRTVMKMNENALKLGENVFTHYMKKRSLQQGVCKKHTKEFTLKRYALDLKNIAVSNFVADSLFNYIYICLLDL